MVICCIIPGNNKSDGMSFTSWSNWYSIRFESKRYHLKIASYWRELQKYALILEFNSKYKKSWSLRSRSAFFIKLFYQLAIYCINLTIP
jgi:hypothetical protein